LRRYGDFSRCNQRYRAEGVCGTTAFRNHLKSKHSTVKRQQHLKVGKNPGSENAHVQPFKYDQEVSLKKFKRIKMPKRGAELGFSKNYCKN
jgi:hypothetical protein